MIFSNRKLRVKNLKILMYWRPSSLQTCYCFGNSHEERADVNVVAHYDMMSIPTEYIEIFSLISANKGNALFVSHTPANTLGHNPCSQLELVTLRSGVASEISICKADTG